MCNSTNTDDLPVYVNDKLVFTFISNLNEVLQFLQILKMSFKVDNASNNLKCLIKRCIHSLITYQVDKKTIYSSFALEILFESLSVFGLFSDQVYINYLCQLLFDALYTKNCYDPNLSQLLKAANKECTEMYTEMNIDINNDINNSIYSIQNISFDIVCYVLSYLDPLEIRNVQCVSYLFYSASQKPVSNIVIDQILLEQITNEYNGYLDTSATAYRCNLKHTETTFFCTYKSITNFKCSLDSIGSIIELFGFPNYEIFWNQFHNIQDLEICDIDYPHRHYDISINNLIQVLSNSKYLKHTLKKLKLASLDHCYLDVTEKTLKYFTEFINLNSLHIRSHFKLHDELTNIKYFHQNFAKIQSYFIHIKNISMIFELFDESINSSFLSLFFHPNIESLYLRLGDGANERELDNVINELQYIRHKDSVISFPWNMRLNHLKYFNFYANPFLKNNDFYRKKPQQWLLRMIASMSKLTTFQISQWDQSFVFGNMKTINNINIYYNILFYVIESNIDTLENIIFCHEAEHSRMYGLHKDSWLPLFLMHNILTDGMEIEYIKKWIQNTFKEFKFCLLLDEVHSYGNDHDVNYIAKFLSLKSSFFARVKWVIKELKKIFEEHHIIYSIKIEFECYKDLFCEYFNEATVGDYYLNF